MELQPWQPGLEGNAIVFGGIDNPGVGIWATKDGSPHHYEVAHAEGIGNFIACTIAPDGGVSVNFGDPTAAEDVVRKDPRLHVSPNNVQPWHTSGLEEIERNYGQWQPGQAGKAIVIHSDPPQVHAWPVNRVGDPHHNDFPIPTGYPHSEWAITPEGKASHLIGEPPTDDVEAALAARGITDVQGAMNWTTNNYNPWEPTEWEFNSAANLYPTGTMPIGQNASLGGRMLIGHNPGEIHTWTTDYDGLDELGERRGVDPDELELHHDDMMAHLDAQGHDWALSAAPGYIDRSGRVEFFGRMTPKEFEQKARIVKMHNPDLTPVEPVYDEERYNFSAKRHKKTCPDCHTRVRRHFNHHRGFAYYCDGCGWWGSSPNTTPVDLPDPAPISDSGVQISNDTSALAKMADVDDPTMGEGFGLGPWQPGTHGKGLQLKNGREFLWRTNNYDGFPTHDMFVHGHGLRWDDVMGMVELGADGSVRPANNSGWSEDWARELAAKHGQQFVDHPMFTGDWNFNGGDLIQHQAAAPVKIIEHDVKPDLTYDATYENRRPVLWHPTRPDEIHVGPINVSHPALFYIAYPGAIEDGMQEDEDQQIMTDDRTGEDYAAGWLGHNPENDWGYHPETNEYGWYGKPAPLHIDEALRNHYGLKEHAPDDELWHFAAIDPWQWPQSKHDDQQAAINELLDPAEAKYHGVQPWRPGLYGKAIYSIPLNRAIAWNVGDKDDDPPLHDDVEASANGDYRWSWDRSHRLVIHPDGRIADLHGEYPGKQETSPQAVKAVADLTGGEPTANTEYWDFSSKTAALNQYPQGRDRDDDPEVPQDKNALKFVEQAGQRYWQEPNDLWHSDIIERNGLERWPPVRLGVKHYQQGVRYLTDPQQVNEAWDFTSANSWEEPAPVIVVDGHEYWGEPGDYHAEVAREHKLTPEQVARASFARGHEGDPQTEFDWVASPHGPSGLDNTKDRTNIEKSIWERFGPTDWKFGSAAPAFGVQGSAKRSAEGEWMGNEQDLADLASDDDMDVEGPNARSIWWHPSKPAVWGSGPEVHHTDQEMADKLGLDPNRAHAYGYEPVYTLDGRTLESTSLSQDELERAAKSMGMEAHPGGSWSFNSSLTKMAEKFVYYNGKIYLAPDSGYHHELQQEAGIEWDNWHKSLPKDYASGVINPDQGVELYHNPHNKDLAVEGLRQNGYPNAHYVEGYDFGWKIAEHGGKRATWDEDAQERHHFELPTVHERPKSTDEVDMPEEPESQSASDESSWHLHPPTELAPSGAELESHATPSRALSAFLRRIDNGQAESPSLAGSEAHRGLGSGAGSVVLPWDYDHWRSPASTSSARRVVEASRADNRPSPRELPSVQSIREAFDKPDSGDRGLYHYSDMFSGDAWEPGFNGKGMVDDSGRVHAWIHDPAQGHSGPHHEEYAAMHGVEFSPEHTFFIGPDGTADSLGRDVDDDYLAQALKNHPQLHYSLGDWKFADRGPSMEHVAEVPRHDLLDIPWHQDLHPLEPWEPGREGKGILHGSEPIAWSLTDKWAGPHHSEVAYMRDPTEQTPIDGYFHIHPNGEVEAEGLGDAFAFAEHDPRMTVALRPSDWHFGANASKIKVHMSDDPGEAGLYEGEEFDQRRPLLFDPKTEDLYVGGYGQYHRDAAESHGLGDEHDYSRGMWLPEGSEHWEEQPGAVEWFSKHPAPYHQDQIAAALNAQTANPDEWHFGSGVPMELTAAVPALHKFAPPVSQVMGIEEMHNVRPWEPGAWGKGVVVDRKPFVWRSDDPLDAHHDAVMDHFDEHPPEGVNPDWHMNATLMVNPKGELEYAQPNEMEPEHAMDANQIAKLLRTKVAPQQWHFGSAPIEIHEAPANDAYVDDYQNELASRRPMMFDRIDKKLYVGNHGWHHTGISKTFGLDDNDLAQDPGVRRYAYGWIDHANPAERGPMNSIRDGAFGWYGSMAPEPEDMEAVHSALRQRFNAEPEPETDEWHFASVPLNVEHIDLGEPKPNDIRADYGPPAIYVPRENKLYTGTIGYHHGHLYGALGIDSHDAVALWHRGEYLDGNLSALNPDQKGAIADAMGLRNPGSTEYHFGAAPVQVIQQIRPEDIAPGTWEDARATPQRAIDNYEPWKPGQDGRAIWDKNTNRVWLWGSPEAPEDWHKELHHFGVHWPLGLPDDQVGEQIQHFNVKPDGTLTGWRGGDTAGLAALVPQLKDPDAEDEWHFGAAGRPWELIGGTTDPADTAHQDGGHYTHWPIVLDHGEHVAYIGEPGTHHVDLHDEFGLDYGHERALVYPNGRDFLYEGTNDPVLIKQLERYTGVPIKLEDRWNFSKIAGPDPNIVWMGNNPNVYEADHSVIYHPKSNTVYVGSYDQHHQDLYGQLRVSPFDNEYMPAAVYETDSGPLAFETYTTHDHPGWDGVHAYFDHLHRQMTGDPLPRGRVGDEWHFAAIVGPSEGFPEPPDPNEHWQALNTKSQGWHVWPNDGFEEGAGDPHAVYMHKNGIPFEDAIDFAHYTPPGSRVPGLGEVAENEGRWTSYMNKYYNAYKAIYNEIAHEYPKKEDFDNAVQPTAEEWHFGSNNVQNGGHVFNNYLDLQRNPPLVTKPWELGLWGKAALIDGKLHMWGIKDSMHDYADRFDPHHDGIYNLVSGRDDHDEYMAMPKAVIGPDGSIERMRTFAGSPEDDTLDQQIAAMHPDLKTRENPSTFVFATAEDGEGYEWGFSQPVAKMHFPEGFDPNSDRQGRIPFVWTIPHEGDNEPHVYFGHPGGHHDDILHPGGEAYPGGMAYPALHPGLYDRALYRKEGEPGKEWIGGYGSVKPRSFNTGNPEDRENHLEFYDVPEPQTMGTVADAITAHEPFGLSREHAFKNVPRQDRPWHEDWHFGAFDLNGPIPIADAPYNRPMAPVSLGEIQPWEKGRYGKFVGYPDGYVHAWRNQPNPFTQTHPEQIAEEPGTARDGWPSHGNVSEALGRPLDWENERSLEGHSIGYISPEGEADVPIPSDRTSQHIESLKRMHPEVTVADEGNWSFSSVDSYHDPEFDQDDNWDDEFDRQMKDKMANPPDDKTIAALVNAGVQPGEAGKGIGLPDGTILEWVPDEHGSPHHDDVIHALHLEGVPDIQYLHVDTDGSTTNMNEVADNAWAF